MERPRDESAITAAEIKFMWHSAGNSLPNHKINVDILGELHLQPVLDQIQNCTYKWYQHVFPMLSFTKPNFMVTSLQNDKIDTSE